MLDWSSADPLQDYAVINNELELYDPQLLKKEQIVVFNKIDVIDPKELKALIKKFIRKYPALKESVFAISAVTGENLSDLMFYLSGRIKQLHLDNPPHQEDEVPVMLPSKIKNKIIVRFVRKKTDPVTKKSKTVWDVYSERFEQVVNMTDLEDREGVERVYHFLEKLGIKNQLRKKGAQPGDRIRIGGSGGKEIRMRQ
jgi:GTP-binding protein